MFARLSLILLLLCIPAMVSSAPEDRGPRGAFIALSTGPILGHALDAEGRSAGSHTGFGTALRFGEEAIDGLTLGLEVFGGNFEGNAKTHTGSLGGLLVQAGWRPFETLSALHFLFSTGVGGGSLSAESEDDFSGQVAGALFSAGVQYELKFGNERGSGFVLSPSIRGIFAPKSGDTGTRIITTVVGLEAGWHFGRD